MYIEHPEGKEFKYILRFLKVYCGDLKMNFYKSVRAVIIIDPNPIRIAENDLSLL